MDNAALQDVVRQAQHGDRAAFGVLYEHLGPPIFRYFVHHLAGHAPLAEDLTEDVFTKMLERLDQYQDLGVPFTAWVFRIAHNVQIDHFRLQAKSSVVPIGDSLELGDPQAQRMLDATLARGLLQQALQQLTEIQRSVVILRFLQGQDLEQTARATDRSADAVKKLQARALRQLHRTLLRQGITLGELVA